MNHESVPRCGEEKVEKRWEKQELKSSKCESCFIQSKFTNSQLMNSTFRFKGCLLSIDDFDWPFTMCRARSNVAPQVWQPSPWLCRTLWLVKKTTKMRNEYKYFKWFKSFRRNWKQNHFAFMTSFLMVFSTHPGTALVTIHTRPKLLATWSKGTKWPKSWLKLGKGKDIQRCVVFCTNTTDHSGHNSGSVGAWINLMHERWTSLIISRTCGSSGRGCLNQLGMLSRQSSEQWESDMFQVSCQKRETFWTLVTALCTFLQIVWFLGCISHLAHMFPLNQFENPPLL